MHDLVYYLSVNIDFMISISYFAALLSKGKKNVQKIIYYVIATGLLHFFEHEIAKLPEKWQKKIEQNILIKL